jgi:hypothetical protein
LPARVNNLSIASSVRRWHSVSCCPGREQEETLGTKATKGMARLAALAVVVSMVVPAPSAGAEEKKEKRSKPEVSLEEFYFLYRNVTTLVSLQKDEELTYNPYYAMYFQTTPRLFIGKIFHLGADIGLTRELTEADDTTESGEALMDDIDLRLGARQFFTIPKAKIDFGADFVFGLPTSKLSQARTQRVELRLETEIGRTFKVLEGVRIAYDFWASKFINDYTTAQRDSPLVTGCNASGGLCDTYVNLGDRNPSWRLMHLVRLSADFTKWFGFYGVFGVVIDYLYPAVQDERVSYQAQEGADKRYSMIYGLELYATPIPALQIALGLSTENPQLRGDSSTYDPFINRYTALYLDIYLNLDGLVKSIQKRRAK